MRQYVLSALLLATLAVTSLAFGQASSGSGEGSAPQRQGPHQGGPPTSTPEAQLDRMSQQLNLTDDQKAQIKPILEDQDKQLQTLRQDTSIAPEDRRAQFQQVRDNTLKKIRPILNADQQKKFDEEMAQRRAGQRGWNRSQPSQ